jgi:glycosyltransferase involved in cell wall biosynthesis
VWNTLIAFGSRHYPSVSTIHDPIRHVGEESALYAGLAGFEVALADRIIVLSQAYRKSLFRFGKPESKVDVLPLGKLGSSESFCAIPNRGQILFLGRIERYKGIDILLDAFRTVRKGRPELSLVIAGRGELTKKLSNIKATEGIKIYNRWLLEEELDQLCLASDLVVLPYIQATQSGVVAKAQALGRPVIVTNVGGLAEQIENGSTGCIIPFNNANALAQAIEDMLLDKKRLSEMGRAAWSLYKKKYSWDNIASQAIEVYERAREDRFAFGPSRMTAGLRAFIVGALSRR